MSHKSWLVGGMLSAGMCIAALAQDVNNVRTLSFDASLEIAQTALAKCRADGYQVTITVLDRLGRSKVVLQDDDANPHTTENSLRKAYTALTSRLPSVEYGKRIVTTPELTGLLSLDKITTIEGGLPIKSGKDLIGAIGVSGAPGGAKDAVCAQAGISKLEARLAAAPQH
jgi:uncharacterized protein GlcG (DUF336 family)